MKTSDYSKYLKLLVLGICGGTIYIIPFIKYVFYDQQIAAMGITNQQSGLLMTMYALGCSILYIPSGIVADKLSPKKCILFSLISTSALTYLYAFCLGNYSLSLFIWLALSFTTVLFFWSCLMKAIRLVGSEEEQGRLYGFYYACNGITGTVVTSASLWVSGLSGDPRTQFFYAVLFVASFTLIASALMFIFFKEDKEKVANLVTDEKDKFKFADVGTLLKNPIVWVFSFIVFSAYGLFSSISYFTPYLTNVIGIEPAQSGIISIIRSYVFLLLAPVGGYLADKVFKATSKWFITAFTIMMALFLGVMLIPAGTSPLLVSIYSLLPGAITMMLYGVSFSILTETKISAAVTGTAIGIASVIGYSPDFFFSTMFGKWLDDYGNGGYTYIFLFLAAISMLGLICSFIVFKSAKRSEKVLASNSK